MVHSEKKERKTKVGLPLKKFSFNLQNNFTECAFLFMVCWQKTKKDGRVQKKSTQTFISFNKRIQFSNIVHKPIIFYDATHLVEGYEMCKYFLDRSSAFGDGK